MRTTIEHLQQSFTLDLSNPLDISIGLRADAKNPVAWYLKSPVIEPVKVGDWIGRVSEGASINFNNIFFNPHGHGTHTECVGHITQEFHSINELLKSFFFIAKLVSIEPVFKGGDRLITKTQLEKLFHPGEAEALIIRSLPNSISKRSQQYSDSNWPYLEEEAARYIKECGVNHLLIDLPSVDKEKDGGKLLAHKAFWDYPKNTRLDATITELIYVPNKIEDGIYLLNLQIASFENDATPSKPVLFKLEANENNS